MIILFIISKILIFIIILFKDNQYENSVLQNGHLLNEINQHSIQY